MNIEIQKEHNHVTLKMEEPNDNLLFLGVCAMVDYLSSTMNVSNTRIVQAVEAQLTQKSSCRIS